MWLTGGHQILQLEGWCFIGEEQPTLEMMCRFKVRFATFKENRQCMTTFLVRQITAAISTCYIKIIYVVVNLLCLLVVPLHLLYPCLFSGGWLLRLLRTCRAPVCFGEHAAQLVNWFQGEPRQKITLWLNKPSKKLLFQVFHIFYK